MYKNIYIYSRFECVSLGENGILFVQKMHFYRQKQPPLPSGIFHSATQQVWLSLMYQTENHLVHYERGYTS